MTPYEQGYFAFMKVAGLLAEAGRTLVSPLSLVGDLGNQVVLRGAQTHLNVNPEMGGMTMADYANQRGIAVPSHLAQQAGQTSMRDAAQTALDHSTEELKANARRAALLGLGAAGALGAGLYYEHQKPWHQKLL